MRFLILRLLTHSELGMFHAYRRQGKEGSKQRAINFDWDVVDRVFPAAKDSDRIDMDLRYETDEGAVLKRHWLKRQGKNWRLEGNCPEDECYNNVTTGCLFAMEVDAGTSPAKGAWAIFGASDEVTKIVLSMGESSQLTKSAMIALYDEEGESIRRTLRRKRPDLFGPLSMQETVMSQKDVSSKGVELQPNPARLVKILSSVGHTLESALADLVDNAISADATKIDITFGRPDGGHGRWLTIRDNGKGMDEKTLAEAMRIGSDSAYEENALGKYGYGLKGASWSQAKIFTVVTKCDGKAAHHLTWDPDDMHQWIAKNNPLEPWEEAATKIDDHGTAVLWKEMRPPHSASVSRGVDPYSAEIMVLERHLALVFHRFLEGRAAGRKRIAININGTPVQANNPVGHPLCSSYDQKTIRLPTETVDGKVQVQAFLLPSEDEINTHHRKDGPEAVRRAHELIGLHGKRNETQGLFIYRHDRLIKWGGWHQMWETNDEKTKLARVVVDFDSVLDETLKINVSKQMVQLPQFLQAEIKKLADPARKESQKKYRRESPKPLSGGQQPAPLGTSVTQPPRTYSPADNTSQGSINDSPSVRPHVLKQVKTDKFIWKVTKGMTGACDLQVSEVNAHLFALVRQIEKDSAAIRHLSEFLSSLDSVDAQKMLLNRKLG